MSESNSALSTDSVPATRKRRGVFGFLFKSALGCTTLALAVLVVVLLLLPSLAGGMIARFAASSFAERFHGTLAIGATKLGWFSDQRVENAVLFDPAKREVARVTLGFPSLLNLAFSGGHKIGNVSVAVDADLVQDDRGVTNLQQALEPREKTESPPKNDASADRPFDPIEWLADLDLDLKLTSSRLTWSDADTRRAGTPFEVRDLDATVQARPRAPLSILAAGRIVSEQPGALALDVTLRGPITPGQPWPFGPTDAKARVEGFSTAMIDGIAGLDGALVELFGPRFTLRVDAQGTTPESGDVTAALESERTQIAVAGRFADGALRSSAEPGVVATFPAPKGLLARFVSPQMPAGSKLEIADASEKWTLRVPKFVVPLPSSGARDPSSFSALLSKAEVEVAVRVPATITFENDATRKSGRPISVRSIQVDGRIAPGAAATARVEAFFDKGTNARMLINASAADPWSALARKAIPLLDVQARLTAISTATLAAFTGQSERVENVIGRTFDVSVDLRGASLDGGEVKVGLVGRDPADRLVLDARAKIQGGILRAQGEDKIALRWNAPSEWLAREIAATMPAGTTVTPIAGAVTVEVRDVALPLPDSKVPDYSAALSAQGQGVVELRFPGVLGADETLRAAKTEVALRDVALVAQMRAGGAASVTLRADVAQGAANGKLAVDVTTANAWAIARKPGVDSTLAADARVSIEGLPSALVDLMAHQDGQLARMLGDRLAAVVEAKLALARDASGATTPSGKVTLDARSETTTLHAAGRLEAGTIVAAGDEGIDLAIVLRPAFLAERTKNALPKGTRVTLDESAGPITVKVRDVRWTMAGPAASATASSPAPGAISNPNPKPAAAQRELLERISKLALRVEATLPALIYADSTTDASRTTIALRDVRVDARLAPDALPSVRLVGQVIDERPGQITADVQALDPLARLADENGLDTWRARVDVQATKIPTAIVDVLAAQNGLLVEALGARVEISVKAPEISLSKGAFNAEFKSDLHSLHAEGRLENRGIIVDKVNGLVARVGIGPLMSERIVGRLVPMLFDLEKPQGAEPARFAVDALSYPLDGDFSKLDADVRLDLGEISYRLLPGFESFLGNLTTMKSTKVAPLRVPIKRGVASYDRLPIKISGQDLFFSGSYDLASQKMKLGTEIPLKLLGKKVNAQLEAVRDVLDPDMKVPIVISGTWKKPSVALGDGFLDKVLENAAKKGLGDLLKGLGGKKKKD